MKAYFYVLLCLLIYSCDFGPVEPEPEDKKLPAAVVVTSEPTGVRLEGQGYFTDTVATTPFTYVYVPPYLSYYKWRFRLTQPGYLPSEFYWIMSAGDTTRYHIEMEPAPPGEFVFRTRNWNNSQNYLLLAKLDNSVVDTLVSGEVSGIGWSPQRTYFSFVTNEGTVLMDRSWQQVSVEPLVFTSGPGWSHTEDKVGYGKYYDGIYIYELATDQSTKVYNSRSSTFDHGVAFSPDDSRLAFTHHEWEHLAWIYALPAAGGTVEVLTDTLYTEHDWPLDLHWVTDSQILFMIWRGMGIRPISTSGVYLLDINTHKIDTLLKEPIEEMAVSTLHQKFAISARSGLYVGEFGSWQPYLLANKTGLYDDLGYPPGTEPGLGYFSHLDFSEDGQDILGTQSSRILYIKENGEVYFIFRNSIFTEDLYHYQATYWY